MTYTLYGSQTSPFVRRIRLLMEKTPFEFKELNIFETDDALTLQKVSPINQVPVLVHGETKIWDSRQIFNYLNNLHQFEKLTWKEENILTAIEGAMTSGVNLLLMQRSGMNTAEPYMFVNRQKERIESVLDFLKPVIENEAMEKWNFISMTLYSFIDWGVFRGVLKIEKRPECQRLLEKYASKDIVQKTSIPKG